MKLSIVIICWNDSRVIEDCLRSIFESVHEIDYEVIVSDNGSTDGSVERIRAQFPAVRLLENRANLGFARGNNVGIRAALGEYILILNPDTIIHDASLDRWIEFADRHPDVGGFGCKVLNTDGSFQNSGRPFPTPWRMLIAALYLQPLGYLSSKFVSDSYRGWHGDVEREVDWHSGCCVMFRGALLKSLGGFDERFFYQFEEVDLCYRVWKAGYPIRFTPEATITHLGGQSVGRFPVRFAIETCRNGYRYYYKHFGKKGAKRFRNVLLIHYGVRLLGYGMINRVRHSETLDRRLDVFRAAIRWNRLVNPVDFVEQGLEPQMQTE